jgi:regulator of sirC expression with transglutaminase-like and TPR domain
MADPVSLFAATVAGSDEELDLARAALVIASGAEPGLDPEPSLEALDRFAQDVVDLDSLRTRLFTELGFRGNTTAYYEPDNSLLHRVIERRTGIPLTLSIVTLEVGRRAGLELDGIGMPAHFLVRDERSGLYVDSFGGGTLLDAAGCEARWRAASGAGKDLPFSPTLLAPVGKRAILARMLLNLANIYRHRGEPDQLEWVLRMRLALPDVPRDEALGLAEAMASVGQFAQAASELEERADTDPNRTRADRFRITARGIRARLN